MASQMSRLFVGIGLVLCLAPRIRAQDQLLDHPESRIWLSGQINVIHQQHPSFFAQYTGENSLLPERQKATSRVLTLYTGLQITKFTEVLFDIESAGGRGVSDAFGLAGFTNLDVVRNPTLGAAPYVARATVRKIIALSGDEVRVAP